MKKLLFFMFILAKLAHSEELFNIQDGMLLQTFALNYEDEFVYTKPNVFKYYQNFYAGEANPIANVFFKDNLWGLYYIGGDCLEYAAIKKTSKTVGQIINIVCTLAEIECIHSWHSNGFGPPEVSWNIFTSYF